jgi:3-hydroxy acid dehydrogenase / malonic semialdehyde reductase
VLQCTPSMSIVLITGATAGIGEATARLLAKNGFDLIINGRRQERLDALAAELQKDGVRILPLAFDVRDRNAVETHLKSLPNDWRNIDVLINNAGLGLGMSPIHEGKPEDWDVMIDTNIKGLLYVSHAVMSGMVEQKKGHIVNLGSIAGKEVYANGNIYCMTKHAVDALTKAMRIDLLPHNIRVTSIDPGLTRSEFNLVRFKGDAVKAEQRYAGITPLNAADIADAILFAITRPPNVCVNDLLIMATEQANTVYQHRQEK